MNKCVLCGMKCVVMVSVSGTIILVNWLVVGPRRAAVDG